jgi:hypothetical protein
VAKIEFPGLEAVAQYLATSKSLREFKSDSDLAEHFGVSRMTIHRAKKDIDVIKRAYWLSMRNQLDGDLVARREYPAIMEKAVELALEGGKIKAMEFCVKRAWPEAQKLADSLSLRELITTNDEEIILPSHLKDEVEDEKAAESKAAKRNNPLEEFKDRAK